MRTLRTYLSPAEAALAKSLLDDHKIFCSIADENANLYGGGPLAMPIRLLVADEQTERANRILEGADPPTLMNEHINADRRQAVPAAELAVPNNPWELLVIASLFLIPGICLLVQKHPLFMPPKYHLRGTLLATSVTQGMGWLAIAVSLSLIMLYFYTRRLIARDQRDALSLFP